MTFRVPLAVLCFVALLLAGVRGSLRAGEPARSAAAIAVLYNASDPAAMRGFHCPRGDCVLLDVGQAPCLAGAGPARTVVLTGHSLPPVYLGRSPEEIADAVACFQPELVVLDTCYGFSLPLLEALAARGLGSLVVGSTRQLPPSGLLYEDRFFTAADASDRAVSVRARSDEPLERFRLDAGALRAARDDVRGWDAARLESRLRRILPNLVLVGLPDSDATLLVPVAPERFRETEER